MQDLSRSLALVPYLQAHPGVTTGELAEVFGTSEKQILVDLTTLWMCGLPGQAGGDIIDIEVLPMTEVSEDDKDDYTGFTRPGKVYLSNAAYMTRPLRLAPDEALSLGLALDFARDIAPSELVEHLDSAQTKLRAALGTKALDAGAAHVVGGEPGVRDALAAAIREHRTARLTHDGLRRTSHPEVEPARLFLRQGYSYLQAWSRERADWRFFRLDRIHGVELGETFEPRPAPALQGSWGELLSTTDEVVLTVAPSARWIAEYFPTTEVDGDRIRLGITSIEWLTSLLLRLGGQVVSVEPATAAEPSREHARAALAHYGVGTTPIAH